MLHDEVMDGRRPPRSRVWKTTVELSNSNPALGIFVDSEIDLSTRYGKDRVFINKTLSTDRDSLSTRPYQQRLLINKETNIEMTRCIYFSG
jgi:hypothetical protein